MKDLKNGMGKGLGSLLAPQPAAEEPQPVVEKQHKAAEARTKKRKEESSVTKGLKDGYTRATIICSIQTIAKIKEIAYLEREPLTGIVAEAFDAYIKKYESKNGEVVPPKKKK